MKNKLIVILYTILSFQAFGQESDCPPWLKNYATTFDEINKNSFSFLDSRLDNIQIVGLGEDTHGTAEFTSMAVSLMIYLAENHNFQIFFIENGFGETTYLNDYINGKLPDAEKILKEHISTWRYQTTQFVSLLNTLKDYNLSHPDKPIQLFGVEMHYPFEEATRLNQYFTRCGLPLLSATFDKTLYQTVSEDEKGDVFIAYQKAKKQLFERKDYLISKSNETEYAYAILYLDIIGQYITAINQTNEQLKHDLRDLYMEINVSQILHLIGNDHKALIWAHNAHIGDWVSNGIVDVLGHHLKRKYGNSYFNIATNFGTGEYLAFPSNANEIGWKLIPHTRNTIARNSFTYCLSNLGAPNTFLDFNQIRENPEFKCKISEPLTLMSGAGAQTYGTETRSVEIGAAFDGILFIEKSTPIKRLK